MTKGHGTKRRHEWLDTLTEPGQSIVIEFGSDSIERVRNKITHAISYRKRNGLAGLYSMRCVAGGFRVWRIE